MSHGRECPRWCSQCAGADVRRVDQSGPELVIDGVPVRAIEPPLGPGLRRSGARGGLATSRITKPRTR